MQTAGGERETSKIKQQPQSQGDEDRSDHGPAVPAETSQEANEQHDTSLRTWQSATMSRSGTPSASLCTASLPDTADWIRSVQARVTAPTVDKRAETAADQQGESQSDASIATRERRTTGSTESSEVSLANSIDSPDDALRHGLEAEQDLDGRKRDGVHPAWA
jgi:hypothetical protein